MENKTLPQNETVPLQTKIEELRTQNEIMDLSIDLAFKERMYVLLKDFDCDPELLISYLKMHEWRETHKLKEFAAKLKERDLALKEMTVERRLSLEERKQALNERKFQQKTGEPEQTPTNQPAPAQPRKSEDSAKQTSVRPIDSQVAPVRTVNAVEQANLPKK